MSYIAAHAKNPRLLFSSSSPRRIPPQEGRCSRPFFFIAHSSIHICTHFISVLPPLEKASVAPPFLEGRSRTRPRPKAKSAPSPQTQSSRSTTLTHLTLKRGKHSTVCHRVPHPDSQRRTYIRTRSQPTTSRETPCLTSGCPDFCRPHLRASTYKK